MVISISLGTESEIESQGKELEKVGGDLTLRSFQANHQKQFSLHCDHVLKYDCAFLVILEVSTGDFQYLSAFPMNVLFLMCLASFLICKLNFKKKIREKVGCTQIWHIPLLCERSHRTVCGSSI